MIKQVMVVLFLSLLSLIILAKATQQNITLRVGVPAVPPFAYINEDQQLVGSVVGLDDNLEMIGKDFSDFGERFELIEQETCLHFSKQSQSRSTISKLEAAIKAHYKSDRLYDIYAGAYPLNRYGGSLVMIDNESTHC